jgi:hypothetical protein
MMASRREFLTQASAAGLVTAAPWHIIRGARTGPTGRTLGFTLTHEHICKNPSERFGGRLNSVATAVDKLKEARDAGTPLSMSPPLISGATFASA